MYTNKTLSAAGGGAGAGGADGCGAAAAVARRRDGVQRVAFTRVRCPGLRAMRGVAGTVVTPSDHTTVSAV